MGKLSDKLDKIFSAITFAEAGEFDTAREMLGRMKADGKRIKFDKLIKKGGEHSGQVIGQTR